MLNRFIKIFLCVSIITTMFTTSALAVNFTNFSGPGVDGKTVSTADYKGKVVLVDFWASWCVPCVQEMPAIVKIYNEYKSKGFEIVGVSVDYTNKLERVQKAVKKLKITWPVIYDGKCWSTKGVVANNVSQIPMTYLIDKKGNARYAGLRGEKLHTAIIELINEK